MTLRKLTVIVLGLFFAAAGDAFAAGSISGRVTSSTTSAGLAGTVIQIYDLDIDDYGPTTTTDATGNYTINLPAGNYAVLTQDTHGYINEIYNNIQCSAVCDPSTVQTFAITNNAVTGIDFALEPGGRMSGTVTSSVTGLPIAGVRLYFVNAAPSAALAFTFATTDASGNYTSDAGTVTGNVYVATFNNLGYQDELYDNIKCNDCDIETGALVPVTQASGASGINFALDPGGNISGTVRDASNNPLANVTVRIINSTGGSVGEGTTDASGNYSTQGVPTGSYYIGTRNHLGFVDEIYDNIQCVQSNCNPTIAPTQGTLIPVTVGATASGKDFQLVAGGTVTGTVKRAADGATLHGVFVGFFSANGGASNGAYIGGTNTNDSGVFFATLPPGTFTAAVTNLPGYANQMYANLPCPSFCNTLNGTQFTVATGATTSNINFSLVANAGAITGTVTNTSAAAVANANMQLYSPAGTVLGTAVTDAAGVYTFAGLAPGSYYVRTNAPFPNINLLYPAIPCINCAVALSGGTLITVAPGVTTSGINFSLAAGGRISGNVTNVAGGAAISTMNVQIFNAAGVGMGSINTNTSGAYATAALPPGNYFVRTAASATQNFIDQVYNGITCVPCTVTSATPVTVTGTLVTGSINFALATGGSISGTVTQAAGGAPIPNIGIGIFDRAGVNVKNTVTDASGNYIVNGLPTGSYYVRANPNASMQNFAFQIYSNVPFEGLLNAGTPVAVTVGTTTTGINLALSSGGTFSGQVTGDAGVGLANVQIAAYSSTGRIVRVAATDGFGNYTITGLPAGSYYVSTSAPSFVTPFYVDEIYDNLPCVNCVTAGGALFHAITLACAPTCMPNVTGTAVAVTNGTNHTGVNFSLASGGGVITGTVTDTAGVAVLNAQVAIFNSSGVMVKTVITGANNGIYFARGLAPGTYYARTLVAPGDPYHRDEAYGGAICGLCNILTASSPITVAANTITTGINFSLEVGGAIAGTITDGATGTPLALIDVRVYNSSGALVKSTQSGANGGFRFDGLPFDSYYVRTAVAGGSPYGDQLYNGIPCNSCTVTTGTPIVVASAATTNIAFGLLPLATNVSRADFNGDGKADILWRNTSGAAAIWLMNGTTTVGGGSIGTVPTDFQVSGTGDYNGDGKADILWRRNSGEIAMWFMNGATIASSGNFGVIDPTWQIYGSGDHNGDGKSDILWRNVSSGAFAIWLMNGATIIGGTGIGAIPTDWKIAGSGDYNGDGKADILWRRANGEIAMYLMNGATVTSGIGIGLIDPTWQILASGDYNGDGKSDFLWRNTSTGALAMWLMNGGAILSGVAAGGAPLTWQVSGTGDHNGDTKSDILWRNNTGIVVIWYMNGGTAFGGGTVATVDTSWQIVMTR